MSEVWYKLQNWSGGMATDKKVGIANSFANSEGLDFRKSPSQMSSLPRTTRMDNGVVTDLIQNEVMIDDGTIYSIGDSGNIYRTRTDTMSLFGNISEGTFGIDYRQDQDTVYVASQKAVTAITKVSSDPDLDIRVNLYGESQSTYNNSEQMGFNVNSDQMNGSNITTVGIVLSEGSTAQRFFQTDIQPISKIGVRVAAKGTGNWTITVHDGLNDVLATATVAAVNIISNSWNYFIFTDPIQVNVGPNNAQTYHWHITSTVADGTVYSLNTNDLSSADMQLWADRLVITQNGMHPMATFQQFVTIGNGRYLSVWEPLGEPDPSNVAWQRQKLSFPPGYEVCGLAVFNEYLAIAAERVVEGDSTPQDGIIFYWDGLSDTYNYFTKIPEGSPQGIHEYQNVLWYVAGGSWYAITSVAATPSKIRALPGAETVYTAATIPTEIYPYSATVRNGIHLMAWPSITQNETIPYGIYSWGRVDTTQENSFGYSYIMSTGTKFRTSTNNLTIGMVKNWGETLRMSWRDGDLYGLDIVNNSSRPAAYSNWESLTFDNGFVSKQKLASNMIVKWLSIQDGVTIRLKYSLDRGDWVYSPEYSNDNLYQGLLNFARLDMGTPSQEARFYEIQVGIEITCDDTVTVPPTVVGVGLIFDDNRSESLI